MHIIWGEQGYVNKEAKTHVILVPYGEQFVFSLMPRLLPGPGYGYETGLP